MTDLFNPPGQTALRYRIGTFGSFREAMLREIATRPELAALTARQSEDYGVALVELWAYVGDILTFYQERYVQEAYLRTAGDRESLARMAALLAFRPQTGVAAETHVAFAVEGTTPVPLPAGLRLQSVPGPGEQPRKYETVEPVAAREALNQVRIFPAPVPANPFAAGAAGGRLAPGYDASALRPGARLLLTTASNFSVLEKQIKALQGDRLTFDPPMQDGWSAASTRAYVLKRQFRLFGHNAPAAYIPPDATPTVTITPGATADKPPTVSVTQPVPVTTSFDWSAKYIDLDGSFDGLRDNTRVLLFYNDGNVAQTMLRTINSVAPAQARIGAKDKTPYAQSTVTRLYLNDTVTYKLNKVIVYELGDEVPFWGYDYPGALEAGTDEFFTAGPAPELEHGRRLLLTDGAGPAEVVRVVETLGNRIAFAPPLGRPLQTTGALCFGNVALATHGETIVNEVLGSGDPSKAGQAFTLTKTPVTFRRSTEGDGNQSTLTIQVDHVTWTEVDSFYGQAPDARVYVTEVDGSGAVTVRFGDGVNGARLPRGVGNVNATYRQGNGADGTVRAGTLTSLLDRPLGLRSATNPNPATGGRDAQSEAELRQALPETMRTFGRAVSIRDFEELSKSFAGVAKAQATPVWNGRFKALHVTVAGAGGAQVDREALKRFLDGRRDPHQQLYTANFVTVPVTLALRLQVRPEYDGLLVENQVRQALLDYLAFDRRSLGEPVYRSDIYRVAGAVAGVAAVLVEQLGGTPGADLLPVRPARYDSAFPGGVAPAELAVLLDPARDIQIRRETL